MSQIHWNSLYNLWKLLFNSLILILILEANFISRQNGFCTEKEKTNNHFNFHLLGILYYSKSLTFIFSFGNSIQSSCFGKFLGRLSVKSLYFKKPVNAQRKASNA